MNSKLDLLRRLQGFKYPSWYGKGIIYAYIISCLAVALLDRNFGIFLLVVGINYLILKKIFGKDLRETIQGISNFLLKEKVDFDGKIMPIPENKSGWKNTLVFRRLVAFFHKINLHFYRK